MSKFPKFNANQLEYGLYTIAAASSRIPSAFDVLDGVFSKSLIGCTFTIKDMYLTLLSYNTDFALNINAEPLHHRTHANILIPELSVKISGITPRNYKIYPGNPDVIGEVSTSVELHSNTEVSFSIPDKFESVSMTLKDFFLEDSPRDYNWTTDCIDYDVFKDFQEIVKYKNGTYIIPAGTRIENVKIVKYNPPRSGDLAFDINKPAKLCDKVTREK